METEALRFCGWMRGRVRTVWVQVNGWQSVLASAMLVVFRRSGSRRVHFNGLG
jgi:hypothetical protein